MPPVSFETQFTTVYDTYLGPNQASTHGGLDIGKEGKKQNKKKTVYETKMALLIDPTMR
jgi:hypothetical protein